MSDIEEIRICAFIDALGTKEILNGENESQRRKLIGLFRSISERNENYGPNVQNLGIGVVYHPSSQVTSFSDNIAISFPIKRMILPGRLGNEPHDFFLEASKFLEHLIIQIVVTAWDALKLGILFRGGISVGRLLHDKKIIAGQALNRAAKLEKDTQYPRFEIAPEVIDIKDPEHGNQLIDPLLFESCIEKIDNRYFIRAFDFHLGYWRDQNYFRQEKGLSQQDLPEVLSEYSNLFHTEYYQAINQLQGSALEKWKWFYSDLERTFKSGNWLKHYPEGYNIFFNK